MKYALLVLVVLSISCSRNKDSTPPSHKYFLDCTVDGRKLHIESNEPTSNTTSVSLFSEVNTKISFFADGGTCRRPGPTCFQLACHIQGQTTGVFTPTTFSIEILGEHFSYLASSIDPVRGNMQVTISKIERSPTPGSLGLLEGLFSGTINKLTDTLNEIPVIIYGSFKLPITK